MQNIQDIIIKHQSQCLYSCCQSFFFQLTNNLFCRSESRVVGLWDKYLWRITEHNLNILVISIIKISHRQYQHAIIRLLQHLPYLWQTDAHGTVVCRISHFVETKYKLRTILHNTNSEVHRVWTYFVSHGSLLYWSCNRNSRYLVCSHLLKLIPRKTVAYRQYQCSLAIYASDIFFKQSIVGRIRCLECSIKRSRIRIFVAIVS